HASLGRRANAESVSVRVLATTVGPWPTWGAWTLAPRASASFAAPALRCCRSSRDGEMVRAEPLRKVLQDSPKQARRRQHPRPDRVIIAWRLAPLRKGLDRSHRRRQWPQQVDLSVRARQPVIAHVATAERVVLQDEHPPGADEAENEVRAL